MRLPLALLALVPAVARAHSPDAYLPYAVAFGIGSAAALAAGLLFLLGLRRLAKRLAAIAIVLFLALMGILAAAWMKITENG